MTFKLEVIVINPNWTYTRVHIIQRKINVMSQDGMVGVVTSIVWKLDYVTTTYWVCYSRLTISSEHKHSHVTIMSSNSTCIGTRDIQAM